MEVTTILFFGSRVTEPPLPVAELELIMPVVILSLAMILTADPEEVRLPVPTAPVLLLREIPPEAVKLPVPIAPVLLLREIPPEAVMSLVEILLFAKRLTEALPVILPVAAIAPAPTAD